MLQVADHSSAHYYSPTMKTRFAKYLAAAFNARPWGMLVAPNWVGIGTFALLGVLNPGLWLIGAGLELLYMFGLLSSNRFRRWVDSQLLAGERSVWDTRTDRLVESLTHSAQIRYQSLKTQCRRMVAAAEGSDQSTTREALGEALGRLVWVYLQLLVTRQATARLITDGESTSVSNSRVRGGLSERVADLERRLKSGKLEEELERSLRGQLELLNQRLRAQREAREKLDYIDSELVRVEEQVQLVQEQSVLTHDPESASRRIDAISSTLGTTTQWIREQQRISGELAESLDGSPPAVLPLEAEQQ